MQKPPRYADLVEQFGIDLQQNENVMVTLTKRLEILTNAVTGDVKSISNLR